MSRVLLRIVCSEHDRVIALVDMTDEGPAFGTRFAGTALTESRRGEELPLDQFRALRKTTIPGFTVLDPSDPPDEEESPYEQAGRGPFQAWCPKCFRWRGDLDVHFLMKTRGSIRI